MNSPLRLAYLVSQYPTVNHTFVLREIRGLRELGTEIRVVSIRPPDRPLDQLSEIEQEEARQTFAVLGPSIGATIAGIAGAHLRTAFRRPLKYLAGFFYAFRLDGANLSALFKNLLYFGEAVIAGDRIQKLDLKHVHTHFSSTVALFLSRVFPITFSATIHGPDEFNDALGFHLREKVAAARFLCAISDYAASQLMRASDPADWHKIEVARLGVDSNVFAPRPAPANRDRIELLTVGRLAPAKAHALLIGAIDQLVRSGRTGIHLRVVGEGPSRAYLEAMIAVHKLRNYVTLEGACNQDRVLEFYRRADIFVLASFAEGVPVVLMEAMAMEIPCIATWITGVPELIRHEIDGWLIPPANERALTGAIAHLSDCPELRGKLGAAGRIRVKQEYDLRSNVALLAEVYRRRLAATDAAGRTV